MSRGSAPTIEAIAAAAQMPTTSCWACGRYRRRPERAHLLPHSLGGSDTDPANYVLLCSGCHLAAPDVRDPDVMLQWMDEQPCETDTLADAITAGLASHPGLTAEQITAAAQHVYRHDIASHQGLSLATHKWAIAESFRQAAATSSATP